MASSNDDMNDFLLVMSGNASEANPPELNGITTNKKESHDKYRIHHSVIMKLITEMKVCRPYTPITLVIGKKEVGKSTLTSVLASDPKTTTIFSDWDEVLDWQTTELKKNVDQMTILRTADEALAKPMFMVTEDWNMEEQKLIRKEVDVTANRPRSVKFVNLIEAVVDKSAVLGVIIKPAVDRMMTLTHKDRKGSEVKYLPGEIPIVYFNESLQDAIFQHDVFFLVVVEGQEAGGSRHKVTLQVKNPDIPKNIKSLTKAQRLLGSKYITDPEYGEKHITCFPVDLMVYFSVLGTVRVTSVNSSTFSSKHVASQTQKGGLNDTVINTPNYISNTIRSWGGRIIMEIRDDWDKADTLFGAGDIAIEITSSNVGVSNLASFRTRDGSLGKREYLATRLLYEVIIHMVIVTLGSDSTQHLKFLQEIIKFMDALSNFAEIQKLKIIKMLDTHKETMESKEEETQVLGIKSALVALSAESDRHGLSLVKNKFNEIKDIFDKES